MIHCMRTTMNLPDALLSQAKRQAAAEGRTLTSLVEEALRARLGMVNAQVRTTVELPSWEGGGFLVDITDPDAMWEALDAG